MSVRVWPHPAPARVVVLSHGYGEHIGRYEHVAAALVERGAVVYGPDHLGHGESEGERVLIADFEHVVDDLHAVVELAREQHPDVPVVMVAHSMGGLIGARYAQRHGDELAGLVLSAPSIGLTPVLARLAGGAGAARRPDRRGRAVARRLGGRGVRERPAGVARRLEADDARGVPPRQRGDRRRPRLRATCRCSTSTARPTSWCRWRWPSRPCSAWRARTSRSEIVPEARHEVFNELEQEETLGLVGDFVERVSAR